MMRCARRWSEALGVIRTLVGEIREVRSRTYRRTAWCKRPSLMPITPTRLRGHLSCTSRKLCGAFTTVRDISAAEYIQRRRELDQERRRARDFFADVDLLITPAAPIPAPAIADLKKNPEALRPAELRLLRNTRPFNVWGLPALSVPCGFTKSGLPIGLQIAGPHWREDLVLRLARAYESATAWHKRRPAVDF